jgi:hypothetical protein
MSPPVHAGGFYFGGCKFALKPATKTLGPHGVFICRKGLKYLIADSAFKRMQVDAHGACWLDGDEHHLGLALRTGGAPNCSERNDGRQHLRLGMMMLPSNRRERNTLCHRYMPGSDGDDLLCALVGLDANEG